MSGYNKAELNLDGKSFPLNIVTGTDGKQGLDIKNLYNSTEHGYRGSRLFQYSY